VASFEAEVEVKGVDGGPVTAAFIRAPWVSEAGPQVEVLAEIDGRVIGVRQGNLLAVAFHPELTGDSRLHRWFVDLARAAVERGVHGQPPDPA
jgi:5'-phosphate synthase pdxT subunit